MASDKMEQRDAISGYRPWREWLHFLLYVRIPFPSRAGSVMMIMSRDVLVAHELVE